MNYKISGEYCSINIDTTIYSIEVIHKCFYWYTQDFDIDIRKINTNQCKVIMSSKNQSTVNFITIISLIKQHLIDFKLREILDQQTQTIRELIIAKAFANYETDIDTPQGEISDPIGFNPNSV